MANQIHIIAPFVYANGGDWSAIDFYLEYSKTHQVSLWSAQAPNKALALQYPIQEIKPYAGNMPNGGTLIISGARTIIGSWYDHAQFDKVVLYHNLLSPSLLYQALNRLSSHHTNKQAYKANVEIIYVSNLVKKYAGLDGIVAHHIPPKSRFKPLPKIISKAKEHFVVGRISTDQLSKYHYTDMAVYKSLIDLGMHVKIVGGTCLMPWLSAHFGTLEQNNISLLPVITQSETPQFYNSLDCFYYRVPSTVKEAYGFVVVEAMLSGLPVVCHQDIGASELIQHGINGFIFQKPDEAIEIINALKNNANLCKVVGMHAGKLNTLLY